MFDHVSADLPANTVMRHRPCIKKRITKHKLHRNILVSRHPRSLLLSPTVCEQTISKDELRSLRCAFPTRWPCETLLLTTWKEIKKNDSWAAVRRRSPVCSRHSHFSQGGYCVLFLDLLVVSFAFSEASLAREQTSQPPSKVASVTVWPLQQSMSVWFCALGKALG